MINTCKEMMNFSDFLIPEDFPPFLSHEQCIAYFEMYTDHFQLRPHIRLRTRVLSVRPAADYAATGRYVVRYRADGEAEQQDTFDAVLACTGHHSKPKTPAFKGLERFQGRAIHSHAYKDQVGFEGKTVVVVGAGNSGTCGLVRAYTGRGVGLIARYSSRGKYGRVTGLDVAVELSRHAKQVGRLAMPLSVRRFRGELTCHIRRDPTRPLVSPSHPRPQFALSALDVLVHTVGDVAVHARGRPRPAARLCRLHAVRRPRVSAAGTCPRDSGLTDLHRRGHANRAAKDTVSDDRVEAYLNRTVDLRMYGLQPKHRVGQAHPSVNGDLIGRINTGVRPTPQYEHARAIWSLIQAGSQRTNRRCWSAPTSASSRSARSCTRTAWSCRATRSSLPRATRCVFTAAPTQRCRCSSCLTCFLDKTGLLPPLGQIAFPYLDPACGVTVVKNEVRRPPRRPRLIFSAFAF